MGFPIFNNRYHRLVVPNSSLQAHTSSRPMSFSSIAFGRNSMGMFEILFVSKGSIFTAMGWTYVAILSGKEFTNEITSAFVLFPSIKAG